MGMHNTKITKYKQLKNKNYEASIQSFGRRRERKHGDYPQAGIGGINETLETIRKIHKAHSELEQRVTLITFDSTHKKTVL